MPKVNNQRTVQWGYVKPPTHKFKNKKCPGCGKKKILDDKWGERCWYCGEIIQERDNGRVD